MSLSEKFDDGKDMGKLFLVCLTLSLVFLLLFKLTDTPDNNIESNLQAKIHDNELAVFQTVEREGLLSTTEISKLQKDGKTIRKLRAKAKSTWDSIAPGVVIRKRGPGGDRPVGKNRKVQELYEQADKLESNLIRQQRAIALDRGPTLLSTPHESLWQEHATLIESVAELHNQHAWYYYSSWGTAVSVIHALLAVPLFISVPITVLLGLWVLFWLVSLA